MIREVNKNKNIFLGLILNYFIFRSYSSPRPPLFKRVPQILTPSQAPAWEG